MISQPLARYRRRHGIPLVQPVRLWVRRTPEEPPGPLVADTPHTCPHCGAGSAHLTYTPPEWRCLCGWRGWTRPARTGTSLELIGSSLADVDCEDRFVSRVSYLRLTPRVR